MITIWHYALPFVRAIAEMKFCQKVTKSGQKEGFFLTYLFSQALEKAHGCRYTLVVCGLQIDIS